MLLAASKQSNPIIKITQIIVKKIAFAALTLCACQSEPHVDIADVRRAENITLHTTKPYPYRLTVQVKGYLNDTARLNDIKTGKGPVDLVCYDGDYYTDTFQLSYEPYKADSGALRVYYRFFTQ